MPYGKYQRGRAKDLSVKLHDLHDMLNQVLTMQSTAGVINLKDAIVIDQMKQDITGLEYEIKTLRTLVARQ